MTQWIFSALRRMGLNYTASFFFFFFLLLFSFLSLVFTQQQNGKAFELLMKLETKASLSLSLVSKASVFI